MLRVNWPLDAVDREAIPRLIEERSREFGPVFLLLEIHDLPNSGNCESLVDSLLPDAENHPIEKLALVVSADNRARLQLPKLRWPNIAVRCFTTAERGDALTWVET